MVLVVDNYGSTANITSAMVRSLGFSTMVVPCSTDPVSVKIQDYGAVILTAGPGSYLSGALSHSLVMNQKGVPLLGVCQAFELIAKLMDGAVVDAVPVMCEDTLSHTGEGLFRGIAQRFRVVLRQSHVIDKKKLPREFEAEAYSSSGAVQSISIASRMLYASGFDPANYRTEHGLKILYNFLNLQ